MASDRKKPSAGFWITVALIAVLVPPCGYAGAYLCMARKPRVFLGTGHGPYKLPPFYVAGSRRDLDQEFWSFTFAPAHWADMRIRPDKWTRK
jgi:hypothetical protein